MRPKKDRSKPLPAYTKGPDKRSNVERALDKIPLKDIRQGQRAVRFDRQRSAEGYTYLNWRPWDDVE